MRKIPLERMGSDQINAKMNEVFAALQEFNANPNDDTRGTAMGLILVTSSMIQSSIKRQLDFQVNLKAGMAGPSMPILGVKPVLRCVECGQPLPERKTLGQLESENPDGFRNPS